MQRAELVRNAGREHNLSIGERKGRKEDESDFQRFVLRTFQLYMPSFLFSPIFLGRIWKSFKTHRPSLSLKIDSSV